MSKTLRTFETESNTYYVGYGKLMKTSFEEQQEQRNERLYMLKQKALGVGLSLVGIAGSVLTQEPIVMLSVLPLGIGVTLTKDHVIN